MSLRSSSSRSYGISSKRVPGRSPFLGTHIGDVLDQHHRNQHDLGRVVGVPSGGLRRLSGRRTSR